MNIQKFPSFQIPRDVKYLSKVIDTLPKNCIYNKVVTGAAATTIALTNNENYIVCVPFTELIHNKMKSHPEVLGVYKGIGLKQIKDYANNYKIPIKKIMVTYDSLPKLLEILNPKEYNLLIDEYQILFSSYVFRNTAIKGVLNNYDKFKSFCFMTASMMEEEFILKDLRHLPVYETDWECVKEVTIEACQCETDVIHTTCFLVENYIKNIYEGNAHIFVNSLEFIKQVIKNCNLTEENCKAVWSKNNNEVIMPILRGTTYSDPKKINFYTSSCYVGCDVKDPIGRIYIVSDSKKPHTFVDIYSEIKQIVGRVRNTIYWEYVTHIYTTKKYNNNLSFEEYKSTVKEEIANTYNKLNQLSTLTDDLKKDLIKSVRDSKSKKLGNYISVEDNKLCFNEDLVTYDLYNFKLTKSTYKVKTNVHAEYENAGYKVIEFLPINSNGSVAKIEKVKPINAKQNLIENIKEFEKGDSDFALYMYRQYDWFYDAITLLGLERIKELKYSLTNIKRYIALKKFTSVDEELKDILLNETIFKQGDFLTMKKIKFNIAAIYKSLGIKKTAKATDLKDFWNTREVVKNINGSSVKGYVILDKK